MLINLRNALMTGKRLPYTPVYGVRSDGVAYCALPNNINSDSGRVEINFDLTTTTFSNQEHLLGGHGASLGSHFLWHLNRSYDSAIYCFGGLGNVRRGFRLHDNVASIWGNGTSGGGTINDSNIWRSVSAPQTNTSRFLIFRANADSTSISPAASSSVAIVIIKSMRVWFGETQVAELIPCREKTTNEVCFFNAVDGQFVKNIAGGSSQLIEVTQ